MLCVAAVVTCKSWGYRITQLSAIRGLYSYFHCYNLDILKYKIIGKNICLQPSWQWQQTKRPTITSGTSLYFSSWAAPALETWTDWPWGATEEGEAKVNYHLWNWTINEWITIFHHRVGRRIRRLIKRTSIVERVKETHDLLILDLVAFKKAE